MITDVLSLIQSTSDRSCPHLLQERPTVATHHTRQVVIGHSNPMAVNTLAGRAKVFARNAALDNAETNNAQLAQQIKVSPAHSCAAALSCTCIACVPHPCI